MPKSPKPPAKHHHDPPARMSDVALRKKKNADAQAAFRARRANYIATLEETVTSLESVVLQLQESCRESRAEALDLRQENARLRHEHREREKFWRALYYAKKNGHPSDPDDLPPPPLPSPFLSHSQVAPLPPQPPPRTAITATSVPERFGLSRRRVCSTPRSVQCRRVWRCQLPKPIALCTVREPRSRRRIIWIFSQPSYGEVFSVSLSSSRSPRDTRWPVPPALQTGLSGSEVTLHASSPTYIESPSLTSTEMTPYPGRFPHDEQKVALNSVLESAPYVFPNGDRFQQSIGESVPNSRSLSPTTSTPSSSTSLPLTSPFPFAFHEQAAGQDRADFDYRRHSLPHCTEVTLHGGTADISLTSQSADGARYRVGRRTDSGADHHNLLPVSESGSDQNDGDLGESSQRLRPRRNTGPSHSRSTSPNPTPTSCTVAVIKAQAFGALRRTRARTKKTSDGAARVAMDVLEARGIDIGPSTGSKRPRLDDEELDEDTP
ncbi:hypothetical protein NLJ89_g3528 [Agrocybe chaxingu]|uniref:BZIP domain-containing protein n=1 Tax=Agrocybe chaxingu TaxID=84603 RepID=A0A9W8MVF0_9AGAR|nr:hypothetical protein NLJ89_g3528 [Agrocybe chaxingu]